MKAPTYVGIDNGGTWIRLVGLDRNGRTVWTVKKPSPPIEKLPSYLKKVLSLFKGELQGLVIGSKGVWKQSKRIALRSALRRLAKRVVVMSDVEAAWETAFNSSNEQRATSSQKRLIAHRSLLGTGVVVIAGTGSIAYGRTADGRSARAGGLGPDKGDEGSGYWIGNEWLERRGAKGKKRKRVRDIALLTPTVIRKAQSGHPLALGIIKEAQIHLAQRVKEVADQLKWRKPLPLSVAGSVLTNPWFKKGFRMQLKTLGLKMVYKAMSDSIARVIALSYVPSLRRRDPR